MNWYKKAQSDMSIFFSEEERAKFKSRIMLKENTMEKPLEIVLYRNFDANLDHVERSDSGNLIFSPQKCEQGVLWFAHSLQGNPQQYYDRGREFLLTYPLQVIYKYKEKTYNDGTVSTDPIANWEDELENSPRWGGYELPDGFLFSYKTQKHIICTKKIEVPPSYVTKVNYELV